MSLVDIFQQLESADQEMQKEAAELEKLAAEEDAAGRIAARGFLDELQKMAALLSAEVSPAAAREAAKGAVEGVSEKLAPHKKNIMAAILGGLGGRALLGKGRGALGALVGLGAANPEKIKAVAQKAKEKGLAAGKAIKEKAESIRRG